MIFRRTDRTNSKSEKPRRNIDLFTESDKGRQDADMRHFQESAS